ncbi:response regulator [Pararhizobium sp.]|uniref:response regulator n=1 Tax=Pararhizobium sp. TaxID=1977563 RepID=UPI0027184004|nr:response regulator [Pararhizobium sp.]MDO9418322.1 response regulator [Pararhizobium sp.]
MLPDPGGAPFRILYIDDDEALCVLLRKNLQREGYAVETALSGQEGLDRLARGGIDVVALDHYLVGETGLDILPKIAGAAEHVPVVYVTGSGDTSVAVEALKRGADDYVTKSISSDFFELLIAALKQAVERAHYRREAAAQQELIRQERDRAELLLSEVNHRVGNSLGLAAALVRMQASLMTDQAAIDALQETQVRINAIGSVHRRLYTNQQVGTVDLSDYLGNLVAELQSSMRDEHRPHEVKLETDPIVMKTDKAIALGLIISELVTNAFKYAYPKGQAGFIRVGVKAHEEGIVIAHVEDDGFGFDSAAPAKGTGLGTKILAAMATSIKSEIRYDPAYHPGTRVMLVVPEN